MLDAHPAIAVPHPPHLMRYLAPLAASYGDLGVAANHTRLARDALRIVRAHLHPWPHPVDLARVVRESDASTFGVVAAIYEQYREAEDKPRWGCKSTFMVDHIDEVLRRYPDARFVWLVRDPLDVAASAKRAVFGPSMPYRMARLWLREQRCADAALARHGPAVVYLLRYEDLVTEPEGALNELCSFLGEPMHAGMLHHHLTSGARRIGALAESWRRAAQPVGADRIGAHRTGLTAAERRQVAAVAAPLARRLGYDHGSDADAAPEEVAPSMVAMALRSAGLRTVIEVRSLCRDRNYTRRLRRDATVRSLRLTAWARTRVPMELPQLRTR